jgi:rubredoxin
MFRMMMAFVILNITLACSFAKSGMAPPLDEIHRHLTKIQGSGIAPSTYPVLPRPVTTENNAFAHNDLQLPLKVISGNEKSLLENLKAFEKKTGEELCYWTFQALPPPRDGPTALNPKRGYYDVADGHYDQDIEWVQAYGEVAVARLHSRVKKGGPLLNAMCSMGAIIASRRCANGASAKEKCIPAITNGTIQWPMAVSVWKVGHAQTDSSMTEWRANTMTGHLPNIEWDKHTPGTISAYPWKGAMPKQGEISPGAMPKVGTFPSSKGVGWGSPKIAKVVKCSDIPSKFAYNTELFYCDHMPSATTSATVSSVDEAYAVWRSLVGVWPPTKPCVDDAKALDRVINTIAPQLKGANCSVVFAALQVGLPNFDCDNSDIISNPTFRDMCCSVCGGQPIPNVPPSPAPPATAPYHCSVCNHVYDPERDGGGKSFEELPESWVCPVCGAEKGAYYKQGGGQWAHERR